MKVRLEVKAKRITLKETVLEAQRQWLRKTKAGWQNDPCPYCVYVNQFFDPDDPIKCHHCIVMTVFRTKCYGVLSYQTFLAASTKHEYRARSQLVLEDARKIARFCHVKVLHE